MVKEYPEALVREALAELTEQIVKERLLPIRARAFHWDHPGQVWDDIQHKGMTDLAHQRVEEEKGTRDSGPWARD